MALELGPFGALLARVRVMSPEEAELDRRRQRSAAASEVWREQVPEAFRRSLLALDGAIPGELAPAVGWAWGGPPVLLLGPSGAGKTTTAARLVGGLLRLWVRDGGTEASQALRLSWWRSAALCDELLADRWGKASPGAEVARRCPLLVVDDLGWERDAAALGDLLCDRADRGKASIVTSGLTLEEFGARYGSAVVRRFVEWRGEPAGFVLEVSR